jgi:tRNA-dihydrouridine synthase
MQPINSLIIKNLTINPPLLLAPMAGVSHSAFRRLLSDFGGYGALFTEMLSPRALMQEVLDKSPFTKKRDSEGAVFYQLQLTGDENIVPIVERLRTLNPAGIDINLGCPAPAIKRSGAGKALFDNYDKLSVILQKLRMAWDGILSVKCRLGDNTDGWEERFCKRIKLFENCSVDALCVHPRFSDEKLKRVARWNRFSWIRQQTRLPLIANGDIVDKSGLALLEHCNGLMIGRAAVSKPWIFRTLSGNPPEINYKETWLTFFEYCCEDFIAPKAIGRIKEFTTYYAKNYFFGHELFRLVQSAPDLETVKNRAISFFDSDPELQKT